MNLDVTKWGQFRIGDLFPILQNGKANQGILSDGNDCFYVGAKKDDNGVMLHCAYDEELIQKGNCIIFICNGQGSVGYANYMDVDFIGTTDIVAGYNEYLNCYNGLFIATVLCQERPKYSFGRKWKTHLRDTIIKLPQTREKLPDWNFMEQYIKSLRYKEITTSNRSNNSQNFDMNRWEKFEFGRLIEDIYKARAYNKDDLSETTDFMRSIKYITRTGENNGCELTVAMRDIVNEDIEPANAITIGDTTATCFYQGEQFITGDHMVVIRANWLNKARALFVLSILRKEQYKYSYGRAFLMDRIKATVLKLPIVHNDDGTPYIDEMHQFSDDGYVPDWSFMENYIKSLPYGDRL